MFFCGVKSVAAQSGVTSSNQSGKIAITGTVLPTQAFLSLLGKNSTVSLGKSVLVSGEREHIEVHISTGGHEKFARHALVLSIRNAHAEEIAVLSGMTDDLGRGVFEYTVDKRFLGKNSVRILDTYYGTPVSIYQSIQFIVYEDEQDDMPHEKERKMMIISQNASLLVMLTEGAFEKSTEDFENNATIAIRKSLSSQRMGPEDP